MNSLLFAQGVMLFLQLFIIVVILAFALFAAYWLVVVRAVRGYRLKCEKITVYALDHNRALTLSHGTVVRGCIRVNAEGKAFVCFAWGWNPVLYESQLIFWEEV